MEHQTKEDHIQVLSGTTLKVYRYLFKQGRPARVSEVQEEMGFRTPSTAHYHLMKLVESGLVHEKGEGYVVDRVLFEDTIRIGKSLIPVQIAFAAFFATTLFFLLTFMRPNQLYATWVLAIIMGSVSVSVSLFQAITTIRKTRTQ